MTKDDARLLAVLDVREADHVHEFEPCYLDDETAHRLEVWDLGLKWTEYSGTRAVFGYRLYSNDALIFEGVDLSGPRGMACERAACEVMCFLTLRPGDVEDDYFEKYTPDQLDWRDTYAEAMGLDVLEMMEAAGLC